MGHQRAGVMTEDQMNCNQSESCHAQAVLQQCCNLLENMCVGCIDGSKTAWTVFMAKLNLHAVHMTECMRKAEASMAPSLATSACVVAITSTSAAFPVSSLVLLGVF